jgi:phage protein D
MSTYQVLLNGKAVDDDFYTQLSTLEVEENADLPDAISLTLPLAAADGEVIWVADARVAPFANVAVVAVADGGTNQCIFDGYVLSHKVHLQPGITASTLEVWGQDASVLMGLEEKVREWSGLTDGAVANQIFSEYGLTPGASNTDQDSPAHTDDAHTLMQRASDIDFLRRLARRNGKWCRVACTDTPGVRTGTFAAPALTGDPAATIDLNDPAVSSVSSLDFSWDARRPSAVKASQGSLTDAAPTGTSADATNSGLPPLDARPMRAFVGRDVTVRLTAAADPAEMPGRAAAVLRDAGWFVRCEGTADLASLKTVLRVGTVVAVQGVGSILSGAYLVWRVRHSINAQTHAMAFTLVRNAVGPPPAGGSGLPGVP